MLDGLERKYWSSIGRGFLSTRVLIDIKKFQNEDAHDKCDHHRLYNDAEKLLTDTRYVHPQCINEAILYCRSLKDGQRLKSEQLSALEIIFEIIAESSIERAYSAQDRLERIEDD